MKRKELNKTFMMIEINPFVSMVYIFQRFKGQKDEDSPVKANVVQHY